MSILTKLFGGNIKPEIKPNHENLNSISTVNEHGEISKDLFVDENPPNTLEQSIPNEEGKIKAFLEVNYQTKGVNDGYDFHSSEALDSNKRKIKSDFRLAIDQDIAKYNSEIFKIKTHLIEVEGIAGPTIKQLDYRITEFQTTIKKLEHEKLLSIEDEGLVMSKIYEYTEGFRQGLKQYQDEKLIASSTGMFNY